MICRGSSPLSLPPSNVTTQPLHEYWSKEALPTLLPLQEIDCLRITCRLLQPGAQDHEDEDAVMILNQTEYKLSLIDAVSLQRLRLPCRSLHCDHLQCFDYHSYLSMNTHLPLSEYRCPLCQAPANPSKVYLDRLWVVMLEKFPADKTLFLDDQGWVMNTPFPFSSAMKDHQRSTAPPVICLESDEEEDRSSGQQGRDATCGQHANIGKRRDCPIDLLKEEEEVEAEQGPVLDLLTLIHAYDSPTAPLPPPLPRATEKQRKENSRSKVVNARKDEVMAQVLSLQQLCQCTVYDVLHAMNCDDSVLSLDANALSKRSGFDMHASRPYICQTFKSLCHDIASKCHNATITKAKNIVKLIYTQIRNQLQMIERRIAGVVPRNIRYSLPTQRSKDKQTISTPATRKKEEAVLAVKKPANAGVKRERLIKKIKQEQVFEIEDDAEEEQMWTPTALRHADVTDDLRNTDSIEAMRKKRLRAAPRANDSAAAEFLPILHPSRSGATAVERDVSVSLDADLRQEAPSQARPPSCASSSSQSLSPPQDCRSVALAFDLLEFDEEVPVLSHSSPSSSPQSLVDNSHAVTVVGQEGKHGEGECHISSYLQRNPLALQEDGSVNLGSHLHLSMSSPIPPQHPLPTAATKAMMVYDACMSAPVPSLCAVSKPQQKNLVNASQLPPASVPRLARGNQSCLAMGVEDGYGMKGERTEGGEEVEEERKGVEITQAQVDWSPVLQEEELRLTKVVKSGQRSDHAHFQAVIKREQARDESGPPRAVHGHQCNKKKGKDKGKKGKSMHKNNGGKEKNFRQMKREKKSNSQGYQTARSQAKQERKQRMPEAFNNKRSGYISHFHQHQVPQRRHYRFHDDTEEDCEGLFRTASSTASPANFLALGHLDNGRASFVDDMCLPAPSATLLDHTPPLITYEQDIPMEMISETSDSRKRSFAQLIINEFTNI